MDTLLPDRYPTSDFFIADIFDASPKDDMASMEHPMFSMATRPDMQPRYYEHNGNTLTIEPSSRGLPTIWDKDILIYCISQLADAMNRKQPIARTIQLRPHDLMVATNRETGGDHYDRLKAALNRLRDSKISTNIKTNGRTTEAAFGYISEWQIVKEDDNGRMLGVQVALPNWIYDAVRGQELLTINRDYFRLRGGLERRLYEIARKHCGTQSKWAIGIALLHKKSGSKSQLKKFRLQAKKIATTNSLPDYRMRYNDEKDQIIFYNRKGGKAAKAQFDDDIKQLFKPPQATAKSTLKKTSITESQIDLF